MKISGKVHQRKSHVLEMFFVTSQRIICYHTLIAQSRNINVSRILYVYKTERRRAFRSQKIFMTRIIGKLIL
jgi:hypothetical protein